MYIWRRAAGNSMVDETTKAMKKSGERYTSYLFEQIWVAKVASKAKYYIQ